MNFHLQLEAISFELLFIYLFFLGKKDVFELSWLVGSIHFHLELEAIRLTVPANVIMISPNQRNNVPDVE